MDFYGEPAHDAKAFFALSFCLWQIARANKGEAPSSKNLQTKVFQVSARGYGCLWVLWPLVKLWTSSRDLPEDRGAYINVCVV